MADDDETVPGERGGETDASPGTEQLASIGQRAAARLIDVVLFFSAQALVFFTVGDRVTRQVDGSTEEFIEVPLAVRLLMAFLLLVVYEVGMVAWRGQTLGKIALRIRVVAEQTGEVPSVGTALVRAGVPALVWMLPVGALAPALVLALYLTAMLTPQRQGLHDRAARTLVVRL